MPLGIDVGLGTGHIVLDADPARPQKRHSPLFSAHVYCGQTVAHLSMSSCCRVVNTRHSLPKWVVSVNNTSVLNTILYKLWHNQDSCSSSCSPCSLNSWPTCRAAAVSDPSSIVSVAPVCDVIVSTVCCETPCAMSRHIARNGKSRPSDRPKRGRLARS